VDDVPSWTFDRRPMRIRFTSPRTTTFIQTLLVATFDIADDLALWSMNAVA
jgi:hypothetical protein